MAGSAELQLFEWRRDEETRLFEPSRADRNACTWIVPFRTTGTKRPLFCACAGGGDAYDYADLAAALPEDQPVYAFALPDLGDGAGLPTVERIASAYVEKIRKMQPQGPYHLFGHSFGGLVVYEMAALLAKEGEDVGLLALLDTEHPAYSRILSPRQRAAFYATYLFDRIRKYGGNLLHGRIDRIGYDAYRLVRFKFKRLVFRLAAPLLLRLGQNAPSAIHGNEYICLNATNAYTPPKYGGRVVLLLAEDRTPEYRTESTLGWKVCATGNLVVQEVPGDHYTTLHPPLVQALAAHLLPFLDTPL